MKFRRILIFLFLLPFLLPLIYLSFFIYSHHEAIDISGIVWGKVWFSCWQSVLTVFLSIMLGGGLAFISYVWKVKNSRWFDALMILPIFLPGAIVALGFITVWGNVGYINLLLNYFGIAPIQFLYSAPAIIASHCYYNIPLVYLAINNRLSKSHDYLEESAKILGASRISVFTTITWPRIKNIVIGAGLMVFLYSFMSFSLPLILGGIEYQTFEVYIYSIITQDFAFASAGILALFQFIGLIVVILFFSSQMRAISESRSQVINNFNNKKYSLICFLRLILILFLFLPIVGVLIDGAKGIDDNFVILQSIGFGFAWIRSLIAAIISILISLAVTLIIITNSNTKNFNQPIILFAISPVILSLAWMLFLGKSIIVMILTYAVLTFPLVYYFLISLWEARPKFFLDVLRILGADKLQSFLASISYLKPAILKSAALIFAYVFGDIAVANLLSPYLRPTAMSLSYNLIGAYRFGAASVGMSFVLLTIFLFSSIILIRKK